ncbi:ArsR/SmtB family transcription factor [Brevibacillus ginsengisoli]|uniref:ArsR/SmtB family transcription factor n=1 Tax=Brevibacillus ginsengisoli TaxID=363854 RepID=UPI003CEBDCD8
MRDDQVNVQQAVKIYKALGEPTRLKIALLLAKENSQCCGVLTQKIPIPHSTLSHHLKQLTDAGLLSLRKDGTFIYYSLNKDVAQKYAPYLLD